MANVKQLKEKQEMLDRNKYFDSIALEKDTCGDYEYCKYCNKKNKYPCASAFDKFMKTDKELIQG